MFWVRKTREPETTATLQGKISQQRSPSAHPGACAKPGRNALQRRPWQVMQEMTRKRQLHQRIWHQAIACAAFG